MEFVFDVDGTLTPSRGKIDPEFKQFFDEFCVKNNVYFVTGSDKDKTVEQLGEDTYALAKVVFNCSGNDIYTTGVNVRKSEWTLPNQLRKMLEGWLQGSNFKYRTGNHIEERPGTVNFSIIGRNCTLDERKEYIKYDKLMRERESIAFQINHSFKEITATVGGETGIDIYPTGCDKGQVYYEFSKGATIHFFGDKMEPGGNDYPLAKLLKHPSKAIQVDNWQHTWKLLKEYD